MALSIFLRAANNAKGCSNVILRQQVSRLGSSTFNNAFTIRVNQPIQSSIVSQFNGSKLRTPLLNTIRNASMAPAAEASSTSTTLWVAERALSVALIGLFPAAIAFPSKPLDVLLAVSLIAHTYWGFEAIISEYVRVLLFGPILPKVAHGLLIAVMVTTLGGLFYLIFNDVGLATTVRRLWAVKGKQ